MKRRFILVLLCLAALMGCTRKVQFTTIEIRDPVRHYYPILQGQGLNIVLRIDNKGKVPLVIKDIQPSCGCIVLESDHEMVVPPERSMYLKMRYDSNKNVGKVEHFVRFWGNIAPEGMAEMRFDVNVVPDASYHHDYEELYEKSHKVDKAKEGLEKELTLGYYVDR